MAFDDKTRGRLQKLVTTCRGLLTDEFRIQVQQTYGLDPNSGDVTPLERLTHLSAAERETADLLRQTLAHYLASEGLADSAAQRVPVIDRIVREQAFTVLNRLAALLMMEARGVLQRPAVGSGQQSPAFELYKMVAGNALGETGQAYQTFLFSLFDEFAQELPALFDRFAPQGRLFPREAALLQVLAELNNHEIQPLWGEDETIGWIYQYFNSKEERKAMRDASQAPRNSRELAVRNQFFTPRYVVEFLVDNTLGRLWFNATGGQTSLRERCQYLIVKSDEEPAAALRLRDPRTLKLLDPACGSMHFGLYAFDLFLTIYREAWEWEQAHGAGSLDVSTKPAAKLAPLCQTYADQDAYLRDVPRLVIENNIYGVDIDPRAAQIASLALWLRSQRAWHIEGVKVQDRPAIGLGHVIAATAPPAENELRDLFAAQLDSLDAELFTKTLQVLKGAPELGILLQVEQELSHLIGEVYGNTADMLTEGRRAKSWAQIEANLAQALTDFSKAAKATYQGRLFAQDALQGLRLIDLCREAFDVVVMNPPFGESAESQKNYIKKNYKGWADNLYVAFHNRATKLLSEGGLVGAISSRSFITYRDFEIFRRSLIEGGCIHALVDLGWGVLDGAQVETAAYVTSTMRSRSGLSGPFIGLLDVPVDQKHTALLSSLKGGERLIFKQSGEFSKLPGVPMCYWSSAGFINSVSSTESIYPDTAYVGLGASPHAFFFRAWWEVPSAGIGSRWRRITRGGDFSPFFRSSSLVIDWKDEGACVKEYILKVYPYLNGNYGWKIQDEQYYGHPGITWGKRNERFNAQAMPAGHIFTDEGQGIVPKNPQDTWFLLGYLNSSYVSYFLDLTSGLQKHYVYIRPVPIIALTHDARTEVADAAKLIVEIKRRWDSTSEISPEFDPGLILSKCSFHSLDEIVASLVHLHEADSALVEAKRTFIDKIVCSFAGLDENDLKEIESLRATWPRDRLSVDGLLSTQSENHHAQVARTICSFLVGVCFGRWNRLAFSQSQTKYELASLDELPSQPPATVSRRVSPDIDEKTIIPADEVAHESLGNAMRDELSRLVGRDSGEMEHAICAALGYRSFNEYVSQPGGFFSDHLDLYSKSRRKAPIYWPLATSAGSYTLWIYYPRLSSQTIYSAINDFVEPKLYQVRGDAVALRNKGSSRTPDDESQYEALQDLEIELLEFRDKLQEIAPRYKPCQDDGVQVTAAPLWQMFGYRPWQKLLGEVWGKLNNGDCDWAQLAMAYWPDRVREKCKTDRSLAIAHGLENLYEEPKAAPKKTRGRKKADI